jgi:DNA-binding LacI/PurR family transcriptional regulator
MLIDQQVSGVVFAGGHYAEANSPHEHYHRLYELRLPVVLVNAAVEELTFPRVSTDDMVAVDQAFGHLLSLGHERIGLVLGPEDHMPSRRKLAAFTAAAEAAGLDLPDTAVEHALFSLEGGQAVTRRLIANGFTAIICASDPQALGAIRAVRRAGLSVPDDVSVVGFDDSAFINCTHPPLTTVRQPIESMGRAAVQMLVNQIDRTAFTAEELLYEPELVVRGSTAPARAATASARATTA